MNNLAWRRCLEVDTQDFLPLDVSDEDEAGRLVDGDADGVGEVQAGSEGGQLVSVRVERHDVGVTAEGDENASVTQLLV